MGRVLCIASSVNEGDYHIRGMVEDAGHELMVGPSFVGAPHDESLHEQVLELIPGTDAVVLGGAPVTRRIIEASAELKVISRSGVGFDAVDVDAAAERGIPVMIAVGSNHTTVAEYAFGFMIALSRAMFAHHQIVLDGDWRRETNFDLAGKTLGIAGLGRIGRALADRAIAFEMDVLAYEAVPDREFVESRGIELVSIDDLCRRSDFISLHLPSLPETERIINADRLGLMKASAYVINTARGSLIDEAALWAALSEGRIAGAGLDVFAAEPPAGSPLLNLRNVITGPHAAGISLESQARMGEVAVRNALDVLAGAWRRDSVVNGVYAEA